MARRSQSHPNFEADTADPVLPPLSRVFTHATSVAPSRPERQDAATPAPDPDNAGILVPTGGIDGAAPSNIAPAIAEHRLFPGHCEARVIQPNCWKLARNSLLTQKPPYGQGPLFFGVGDLVQLQDGFGRFVTRGTITGVVGFSEHFVVFEVDGRTQAYGITDVPQPNLYTNQFAVPRERAREVARWTATKWLVDTARVLLKKKGMLWMGDILDRMNRMEDDVPLQLPTV